MPVSVNCSTNIKKKKDYAKVNDCYKNLIGIARKANNAPLMERTYESYIVWTDSVKALTGSRRTECTEKENMTKVY